MSTDRLPPKYRTPAQEMGHFSSALMDPSPPGMDHTKRIRDKTKQSPPPEGKRWSSFWDGGWKVELREHTPLSQRDRDVYVHDEMTRLYKSGDAAMRGALSSTQAALADVGSNEPENHLTKQQALQRELLPHLQQAIASREQKTRNFNDPGVLMDRRSLKMLHEELNSAKMSFFTVDEYLESLKPILKDYGIPEWSGRWDLIMSTAAARFSFRPELVTTTKRPEIKVRHSHWPEKEVDDRKEIEAAVRDLPWFITGHRYKYAVQDVLESFGVQRDSDEWRSVVWWANTVRS